MGGSNSPGSNSSSSHAKESDKPGTFFLGQYRVVDEIGVGGMASVHLGRMDGPGGFQKWVAIKRIHPHLVEDDQFVDMFLDEARIAARISHPNVAQVFTIGKDDNTYWIAMEYLHGEPLREVMRRAEDRGIRISPELAARICADAADGLHAAHELRDNKSGQLLGLVHRDVTPHNLFMTYDGYTKVVDFGIAKVADRLSTTRAGTLKGKLAYMSPEQVSGAKDIDRTTDIFALGVVLWELTTNQRLFRMDTDLDTLEKVQKCEVTPPSQIVPGYPRELEEIVLKALARDRRHRFQTAEDFSSALNDFLMHRGVRLRSREVGDFMRSLFADRMKKRDDHLRWAGEVTSTINVDQLKSGGGGGGGGMDDDDLRRSRSNTPRSQGSPASGIGPIGRGAQVESQMASSSLMDDDEDVPTTVANREQVDPRSVLPDRMGPRPAAGMPAAPQPMGMQGAPPPMGPPAPHAPHRGPSTLAMPQAPQPGPGPSPYGARPSGGYPAPQYSPQQRVDERTIGLGDDDLGSTIALPNAAAPQPDRARPTFGQAPGPGPGPGMHGQGYGAPPYNGQGYGAPQHQQPQGYPGAPSGGPTFGPAPSGGPPSVPTQAFPMPPMAAGQQPQSQIETALSLPRPDPAALWMAQQDAAKRGQRRNTGVIIAVVALTALCIIGIAALVYFKMQKSQQAPPPSVTAETSAPAAAAPPPPSTGAETTAAAAPPPAPAAPPAETTAAAAPPPAATPAGATVPAAAVTPKQGSGAAPAPSATATEKEEPGFLTIYCDPACDDVLVSGRSVGPSPVLKVPTSPGQHRVTGRRGSDKKVISVIVVSGQTVAQRITMR